MPLPSGPGRYSATAAIDVLEAVGAKVLEELLHPARLELEDALGLARREELVRGRVVQGDAREIESLADVREVQRLPVGDEVGAGVDEPHGDVEHRQRLEAEEVELDETRLLDVVLVVLRDERARSGFASLASAPFAGPLARLSALKTGT